MFYWTLLIHDRAGSSAERILLTIFTIYCQPMWLRIIFHSSMIFEIDNKICFYCRFVFLFNMYIVQPTPAAQCVIWYWRKQTRTYHQTFSTISFHSTEKFPIGSNSFGIIQGILIEKHVITDLIHIYFYTTIQPLCNNSRNNNNQRQRARGI